MKHLPSLFISLQSVVVVQQQTIQSLHQYDSHRSLKHSLSSIPLFFSFVATGFVLWIYSLLLSLQNVALPVVVPIVYGFSVPISIGSRCRGSGRGRGRSGHSQCTHATTTTTTTTRTRTTITCTSSTGTTTSIATFPIYFDSTNCWHRDIRYHSERPERITVCIQALVREQQQYQQRKQQQQLSNINDANTCSIDWSTIDLIDVADIGTNIDLINNNNNHGNNNHKNYDSFETNIHNVPFSEQELEYAKSILYQTHTTELVNQLETKCIEAKKKRIMDGKIDLLGHMGYIDSDTYVTTESYNVCLRAMATWIRSLSIISPLTYESTTLRQVLVPYDHSDSSNTSPSVSTIDNTNNDTIRCSMALTRPPGHHAMRMNQNGFCLFNFAAGAAISYIDRCYSSSNSNSSSSSSSNKPNIKISILDWDVHYGQGITDIVRHEQYVNNIRYVSIHQVPAFPYEGELYHRIYPNVLTIPMKPDTTWTCGYNELFQKALNFIISTGDTDTDTDTGDHHNDYSNNNNNDKDEWIPTLIIVCAGYDALASDELASTNLIASDYYTMTKQLLDRVQTINHNKRHNSKQNLYSNNDSTSLSSSTITCTTPTTQVLFGLEGGYQLENVGPSGNLPEAVVQTVKAVLDYQQQEKRRK